jgi:hypothetical protein
VRYESSITVQTPAPDLNLLTIAQLRAAAGVEDTSEDTKLTALGTRVSAMIAKACRVVQGGATPPTLRKERLIETFRRPSCLSRGTWPYGDSEARRDVLNLARFPVVSITSIVADGTTLDPSNYELRGAEGAVVRLLGDQPTAWLNTKIIATYDAGYETVPDDLVLIASQFAQILWYQDGRDPAKRSEAVVGIGQNEWFQDAVPGLIVPQGIVDALTVGGYVNYFPR